MDDNKYYVMMGSERLGPMSLDELRGLALTPTTPVWRPGMADWANASTLPELAQLFGVPQPPQGGYYSYQQQSYQQYGAQQPPYQQYAPGYDNGGVIPPRPNNYLVWAIIVTVCCCLVGGIVSLVYSSKVNSAYDRGDYAAAESASSSARTWCIVSAVIGFIGSTIYGITMAAGVMGNLINNY